MKGRRCAGLGPEGDGCTTILSSYNLDEVCWACFEKLPIEQRPTPRIHAASTSWVVKCPSCEHIRRVDAGVINRHGGVASYVLSRGGECLRIPDLCPRGVWIKRGRVAPAAGHPTMVTDEAA